MKNILKFSKEQKQKEAKSAKKLIGEVKPKNSVLIGGVDKKPELFNKSLIKRAALLAFFALLALLIGLVIVVIVTGKNNQSTANQTIYGNVSDQQLKDELEKELNNSTNSSDINVQQAYYDSLIAKLYSVGDSRKTADLYVSKIQSLNITFDIETQEWLVSSLIAYGYKDSAKKAINDTLAILAIDLQKSDNMYKKEIAAKIENYKKLESNL